MSIWLVSITKDNWDIFESTNFKSIGFSDRYIRTLHKVKKNDYIVVYLASRISAIAGLFRVTSAPYAVRRSIWVDNYFTSINLEPLVLFQEKNFVDIRPLLDSFSFVTNKINWGNYFRQSIKKIDPIDFHIFEKIFKKKFKR